MATSTWKDDIIRAILTIGGEGHYSDIYQAISEVRAIEELNNTGQATVRGTIERFSSDSEAYRGREDLFYSVRGLGQGIWGLREFNVNEVTTDLTEDDIGFPEGKKLLRKHILKERNQNLIRRAKELFFERNSSLFCEVFGFNFYEVYGEIGRDFIEAHHIIPVSELLDNSSTKIDDLIMVCSNCHKMLHRKRPWLTKESLNQLI